MKGACVHSLVVDSVYTEPGIAAAGSPGAILEDGRNGEVRDRRARCCRSSRNGQCVRTAVCFGHVIVASGSAGCFCAGLAVGGNPQGVGRIGK